MSANECISLHDNQALRDLANGQRVRRFWAQAYKLAEKNGLERSKVRDYLKVVGLPGAGDDITTWLNESRRQAAIDVGFLVVTEGVAVDWEGLAEFMNALMPLILEMMAASGVAEAEAIAEMKAA
jgi:hypothetical protein